MISLHYELCCLWGFWWNNRKAPSATYVNVPWIDYREDHSSDCASIWVVMYGRTLVKNNIFIFANQISIEKQSAFGGIFSHQPRLFVQSLDGIKATAPKWLQSSAGRRVYTSEPREGDRNKIERVIFIAISPKMPIKFIQEWNIRKITNRKTHYTPSEKKHSWAFDWTELTVLIAEVGELLIYWIVCSGEVSLVLVGYQEVRVRIPLLY